MHNLVLPFCTHSKDWQRELVLANQPIRCSTEICHSFFQTFPYTSSSHQVLMRHAFILEVCLCIVLKKFLCCVWTLNPSAPSVTHMKLFLVIPIYYLLNKLQEYISLSAIGCYLDETQVSLVLSTRKYVASSWEND